jgi:mannonate dehydratase
VQITFRWFGPDDPVTLEKIRQIPGVDGIVSALDLPPGEPWSRELVLQHAERIEKPGFRWVVAESIPVHEDIKLGRATRDRLIDNYCRSIEALGSVGVPVVCYNFMPVFDWVRTNLELVLDDGSRALAFDDEDLARIDLSRGTGDLPGWGAAYDGPALKQLLTAYAEVSEAKLWENLAYFLERVIPFAQKAGVKMAIHPDDPPWPVFGLPRIITDGAALERVTSLVDSPANGITFCTGSLAANPENDLPVIARKLAASGRIHFVHARNVRVTGHHQFHETMHPTPFGDVNMLRVLSALRGSGFNGPIRPDHGRMIWGEKGKPGYGLNDRALGASYLYGLWEGLSEGNVNAK